METSVAIKKARVTHTLTLEVSYPGLEPPVALFSDLEMIGWKVPPPVPPPATAIDWTTPNPVTGERFTITEYLVEAAVVEPPAGSGRHGAWTDGERPAFERSLRGVLARHGLEHEPEPEVVGFAQRVVEPAGRGRRLFGSLREALPAEPPPEPVAVHLPASIDIEGGVRLEATVDPVHHAALAAKVAALGLVAEFRTVDARHVESYRGSRHEKVLPASQAVVLVAHIDAPQIATALAEVGLLDPANVLEGAAPAERASSEPGIIPLDGNEALITLTSQPRFHDDVTRMLASMGLVPYRTDRISRLEEGTFRGSSYQTIVEMDRLSVAVPSAAVEQVASALAAAAQIDVTDAEHLLIESHESVAPEARAG